jgi:two-component system, NtrC family, sensor kinase
MEHITKSVKSMKSLAQPDVGEKLQVNINEMIEDVITISRNEWKYSAEVTSELDNNLQEILCNPAEINQALLELIINSSYAISDKIKTGAYEKGKIEISTEREDDMVVIKVKDDGTGIPEEVKNRVFDPFFTTHDVGEGTGSGLSYVYATIVRNHEGSIDIHSNEKSGTEFTIRLPVSEQTKNGRK